MPIQYCQVQLEEAQLAQEDRDRIICAMVYSVVRTASEHAVEKGEVVYYDVSLTEGRVESDDDPAWRRGTPYIRLQLTPKGEG